jgi:hypothetical protein
MRDPASRRRDSGSLGARIMKSKDRGHQWPEPVRRTSMRHRLSSAASDRPSNNRIVAGSQARQAEVVPTVAVLPHPSVVVATEPSRANSLKKSRDCGRKRWRLVRLEGSKGRMREEGCEDRVQPRRHDWVISCPRIRGLSVSRLGYYMM